MIASIFHHLVRETDDNLVMVITGFPKQGKSTLAIDFGRIFKKLDKQPFSLKSNVRLIPQKEDSYNILQIKDDVIVHDEAYFSSFNQKTMEKRSIDFAINLGASRSRHNIFIFCFSEVHRATKPILERATVWCHIPKQPKAILFVRQRLFTPLDPWGLEPLLNSKTESRINYFLRHNPNYVTTFKFSPMPPKLFRQYTELKQMAQEEKGKLDMVKEANMTTDTRIFEDIKRQLDSHAIGIMGIRDYLVNHPRFQMLPQEAKVYEKDYLRWAVRNRFSTIKEIKEKKQQLTIEPEEKLFGDDEENEPF